MFVLVPKLFWDTNQRILVYTRCVYCHFWCFLGCVCKKLTYYFELGGMTRRWLNNVRLV